MFRKLSSSISDLFNNSMSSREQNMNGMSPLHLAVELGDVALLKRLLARSAENDNCSVDVEDDKGRNPLHYASACTSGNAPQIVALLLNAGADVDAVDFSGMTPVHVVARQCDVGTSGVVAQVTRQLLDANADFTVRDRYGRTPLDLACECANSAVLKVIFDSEVFDECLDALLSESASNSSDDAIFTAVSALSLAARNGHTHVCGALLARGFPLNTFGAQGTAAHEALRNAHMETLRLLLFAGINADICDMSGNRLVDVLDACQRADRFVVDALDERLIREYSHHGPRIYGRALRDFTGRESSSQLTVARNDLIWILDADEYFRAVPNSAGHASRPQFLRAVRFDAALRSSVGHVPRALVADVRDAADASDAGALILHVTTTVGADAPTVSCRLEPEPRMSAAARRQQRMRAQRSAGSRLSALGAGGVQRVKKFDVPIVPLLRGDSDLGPDDIYGTTMVINDSVSEYGDASSPTLSVKYATMGRLRAPERVAYHETEFGAGPLPRFPSAVGAVALRGADICASRTSFGRLSRYSNCSSASAASSGASVHSGPVLPPPRADSVVSGTSDSPSSAAMSGETFLTYSMYAPGLLRDPQSSSRIEGPSKKASCPAALDLAHHSGPQNQHPNEDSDYGYIAPRSLRANLNFRPTAHLIHPEQQQTRQLQQEQQSDMLFNQAKGCQMDAAGPNLNSLGSLQQQPNTQQQYLHGQQNGQIEIQQQQQQRHQQQEQQQQRHFQQQDGEGWRDETRRRRPSDENDKSAPPPPSVAARQSKGIQICAASAAAQNAAFCTLSHHTTTTTTEQGQHADNNKEENNNNNNNNEDGNVDCKFYGAATEMRQNNEENNNNNNDENGNNKRNNNNNGGVTGGEYSSGVGENLAPNLKVDSNSQPKTTTPTTTTTNETTTKCEDNKISVHECDCYSYCDNNVERQQIPAKCDNNKNSNNNVRLVISSTTTKTTTAEGIPNDNNIFDKNTTTTTTVLKRQQNRQQQIENFSIYHQNNNADNEDCDDNNLTQQQRQWQSIELCDEIYEVECDGAAMRPGSANSSSSHPNADSHFTTVAMTAAAAALAGRARRTPTACLVDAAAAASNRNSTGSTSSGSQASSGFESAKNSNCSESNLAQPHGFVPPHPPGMNAAYSLESPSASSIVSSTSSGAGSTASRCSTYYGSMDCYDANGGQNGGACSTTPGPSCASSGILSDASSSSMATTVSPSTSSCASSIGGAKSSGGRVNVADMLRRGISESEILAEWLQRLCLSQYLTQFITQGYDLASIARATPEDLTALGITRPEDRKRLMQDIQLWAGAPWADNWPTHMAPDDSVRDWLTALGLVQYVEPFEASGCRLMREAEKLTWEDLEDMGVKKLGHMKRICIALKRHKATKATNGAPATTPLCQQRQFDGAAAVGYATIHRRQPQQQQQQLQQQYDSSQQQQTLSRTTQTMPKQRPVVTVLPNQQHHQRVPNEDEDRDIGKDSCYSDVKAGTVTYRAETVPQCKQPPPPPTPAASVAGATGKKSSLKLNLFRTSQILSEFAELPKSLDGAPLNPLNGGMENGNGGAYSSRGVPPPPAPLPYASNAELGVANGSGRGRHESLAAFRKPYTNDAGGGYATLGGAGGYAASQSQPSTPRNMQRLVAAPAVSAVDGGDEFAGEFAAKDPSTASLRRQFHSNESFGDFENIIRDLSHQLDAIQRPANPGQVRNNNNSNNNSITYQQQQQQQLLLQQQQQRQQRYLQQQYLQQQQQEQQLKKAASMASTRR